MENYRYVICNSASGRLNVNDLPQPTDQGIIYVRDFNERYTQLGDMSTINTNGRQLLHYIQSNHLTRWETRGATHAHGGTLDHIVSFVLVEAHFNCTVLPLQLCFLFMWHSPSSTIFLLVTLHHHRPCINIPPKYCPNYIAYMTAVSPTFEKCHL